MPKSQAPKNTLFQVSLGNALEQGVFDGDHSFHPLMQFGNMGLGTFEHFDGEMVAVDGEFFQIKDTGEVSHVKPDQITPFAQVINFQPSEEVTFEHIASYAELTEFIESHFVNKNVPYAIRIDGQHHSLKIRSVCKQHAPYPPVIQAVKEQVIFDLQNSEGSMVGFWFPDYWVKISLPGLHLHFMTEDRKKGGHVLEANFKHGKFSFSPIQNISICLPGTETFEKADLSIGNLSASILQTAATLNNK